MIYLKSLCFLMLLLSESVYASMTCSDLFSPMTFERAEKFVSKSSYQALELQSRYEKFVFHENHSFSTLDYVKIVNFLEHKVVDFSEHIDVFHRMLYDPGRNAPGLTQESIFRAFFGVHRRSLIEKSYDDIIKYLEELEQGIIPEDILNYKKPPDDNDGGGASWRVVG